MNKPSSSLRRGLIVATVLLGVRVLAAEDSFRPPFNGKDLAGWMPVNVPTNTFTVRDGIIVSTGKPTGIMRTDRMYENFVMELEWKHLHPKGNAGIFIWSEPMTAPGTPFAKAIEVQVLDPKAGHPDGIATGHGDIFAIHGAHLKPDRPHPGGWERCLPSEHRVKPAGEWNHYRIEANNGRVTLAVNGKVVSGGSDATQRKGYICLESEGSECHFRNLRIRELASSNPPREQSANEAGDWRLLYNGLDLAGWRTKGSVKDNWKSRDWVLQTGADGGKIWSEEEFGHVTLQLDWRGDSKDVAVWVMLGGDNGMRFPLLPRSEPAGRNGWHRTSLYLSRRLLTVVHNMSPSDINSSVLFDMPRTGSIGFEVRGGSAEFANIFVKTVH